MGKIKLALGAELDILNATELDQALGKHSSWEREAAFGLRHIDLPLLQGPVAADGTIALGADQTDGKTIGPGQGFTWSVKRLTVAGLQANEQVAIFKGKNFVCNIRALSGMETFGKGALMMRPPDFLRVVGAALTVGEQITLSGEADMAPGPLIWKLLA